jgi:hypothetical protein
LKFCNQLTTYIVVVVVVGKQGQNQFPPLPGAATLRENTSRDIYRQRRVATDLLKLRHAMQF